LEPPHLPPLGGHLALLYLLVTLLLLAVAQGAEIQLPVVVAVAQVVF
jgi:hypothetical protein